MEGSINKAFNFNISILASIYHKTKKNMSSWSKQYELFLNIKL